MLRLFVRSLKSFVPVLLAGTAAAQTGSITGKITDAATGAPLPGVAVLSRSAGGPGLTAMTREDGTYRIGGLAAGSYDLEATKIGYAPRRAFGVSVSATGATTVHLAMSGIVVSLNPIVTTASRGVEAEKMLEAPASIAVVSSDVLNAKPAPLITDYLKTVPGVSIISGGITQSNIVSRGFNNAFSTQMLGLQDYRFSGLPALRGNLPFLYTGTNEDIDRIEVLNGPAAALYGPNSANGVIHIITKSPFKSQGTSVTLDGGERSIMRVGLRSARVFGDKDQWGAKVSGEYFTGNDWPDADPNLPSVFPGTAPAARAGKPLKRPTLVRRWNTEARLDYQRPDGELENTLTGGYTMILNSNEITSAFGPTQGRNWSYTSLQDRVRYKKFFAQVFYDGSNAGNSGPNDASGSYYLTTGIPIVDKSSVLVYQAQQSFALGKVKFIAGADYIATHPRSEGSVYGRYDTDPAQGGTDITEQGVYLHATVPITKQFEFVGAARGDQTNRLSGTQFSPRAAFVYRPDANNNFRATFSRAFNSPIGFQYFLDQVVNPQQAPGFALRAIGNPSKTGWKFNRSCDASLNTGLCMHSPWVAQGGGAAIASSAAAAFPGFLAALPSIINVLPTLTASDKAALNGLLAGLNPILSGLRPTAAQVGSYLYTSAPVAAANVRDIEPLRASFNNTWELGYKGIINQRTRVALDLWYQNRGDVGTQLALVNPLVMYEPTSLGTYLATSIAQGLVAAGQSPASAQATATAAAGALVPLMAAFPQGTVALASSLNNDPSMIVTYYNGSGNFSVRGLDLAVDYQPTERWFLSSTYSFQDKIVFPEYGGAANPLMSNSPKHRATAGARYSDASGLSLDGTVRYADAFPVNSGYYNTLAPNVFNAAFKTLAAVPSQTVLDLGMSYRFDRLRLTWGLTASNVFNTQVANFAGTPIIGRLVMTRLKYDF